MLVCLHTPLRLSLHYCQVLHVAVLMKNQAAVQALLESGFSSMCRNSRRWTALDEAISTRHHGITKLLYMHAYAYKKQRMKEKKAQLLTTCNELPNYSVKVCSNQGAADLCLLLHFTVRTFDVVGHLGNCDEACGQPLALYSMQYFLREHWLLNSIALLSLNHAPFLLIA